MKEKIIAIPWDGYDFSLKEMKKRDELKEIVRKETGSDNATSVSTWAGQIYNFCVEMKKGDYVIIPSFRSRYYVIAKIIGEYKYSDWTDKDLYSFRPAMAYMLYHLQNRYPNTEIHFVMNSELKEEITASSKAICEHYGVNFIQLENIHKINGHPSIKGMEAIAEQIAMKMKSEK